MAYGDSFYGEIVYGGLPDAVALGSISTFNISVLDTVSEGCNTLIATVGMSSEEASGGVDNYFNILTIGSSGSDGSLTSFTFNGESVAAEYNESGFELSFESSGSGSDNVLSVAGIGSQNPQVSGSTLTSFTFGLDCSAFEQAQITIASIGQDFGLTSADSKTGVFSVSLKADQPPPSNEVYLYYDLGIIESYASVGLGSDVVIAAFSGLSEASQGSNDTSWLVDITAWPAVQRVAYVMNTTTTELTQYTNFDFTNIIRLDNEHFGIKADGLYRFIGSTDNGTAIDSRMVTHETDFGINQLKNIPTVWIDSDDQTYFKSIVDGSPGTEQQASHRGHKTKLPHGTTGRWWQYQIRNVSGKPMRLTFIESVVEALKRRI